MQMKYPGADLADYREQTERQATMPGVMRPSFRCRDCGQSKGTKGRQRLAHGWRCEACKIKREAA